MAKGRLSKPRTDLKTLVSNNQSLSVNDVIQNIYKTNPELFSDKLENLSDAELNRLAENILGELSKSSEFNKVLGEDVFRSTAKSFKEDEVFALREKNRKTLKELKKEFDSLEKKLETAVRSLDYYQDYDDESANQTEAMAFYFESHSFGKMNYSQYLDLKKKADLLGEFKSDKKKNKSIRRLKKRKNSEAFENLELVDMSEKYKDITSDSILFQLQRLNKQKARKPWDLTLEAKKITLDKLWEDFKKGELSLEDQEKTLFESSDLGISIGDLIGEWADGRSSLDESKTTEVGLIPIYEETVNNRTALDEVSSLVAATDEQNSAVSNLLGGKKEVEIKTSKGKKKKFNAKDVLCFECFQNVWSLPLDFKFGLNFELDLSKFCDTLNEIVKKIKYALDIPYLIKQNFCSLVRFGALCPLELAFLIAAAISNLVFAWQEIWTKFPDFLQQLAVAAFIKPFFNIMQLSLRASASPWPGYQACVFTSIRGIQDLDNVTKRYGFTVDETYEKLLSMTDSTFVKKIGETVEKNTFGSGGDLQMDTRDTLKEGVRELATMTGGEKYWKLVTSPLFGNVIDPLEAGKALIQDAGSKLISLNDTVRSFIASIDAWIKKNSISRLEMSAKIMSLTAFIGILGGLLDFVMGGKITQTPIKACIGIEDGDTVTAESPWNIKEIADAAGGYLSFINEAAPAPEMPPETIDDTRSPSGRERGDIVYIYNPLTDKRFAITNCDKAKSSIISKGESLEFWKRIALGADIDNV